MFVRNWMSAPVVSIEAPIPVPNALKIMEKHHVRRMPVVSGGKLVGIVTKSDLFAVAGKAGKRGKNKLVSDVMTRKVLTVAPNETLERAAQTMLEKKISGIPVVEGEKLVGIITESDLFRALCGLLGISEPGARLVLTVDEQDDVLDTVRDRVKGMALRSLATYRNPEKRRWEIVARVRGRR